MLFRSLEKEVFELKKFQHEQITLNNAVVKGLEIALEVKQNIQHIPYYGPIGEA